ncbi:MAG: VacJ family lipoprotein [Holosporaceae bacterium]|nr:MAG: VacJ family lipoprotein [Holosporaceae bacterium]
MQRKKEKKALASFSRFCINTVFGVFGIFDVAKKLGLDPHRESFNTTLKYYGVPQGPYLVLPVLGPTNPRYIAGTVFDYFIDPVRYYAQKHDTRSWTYWRTGMHFLTVRANITEDIRNFRENSIDFYAALRSFFKQYMDASRMDGRCSTQARLLMNSCLMKKRTKQIKMHFLGNLFLGAFVSLVFLCGYAEPTNDDLRVEDRKQAEKFVQDLGDKGISTLTGVVFQKEERQKTL